MAFCESYKQRVRLRSNALQEAVAATVVSKCDVFTLGSVEIQLR